MLWGGELIRRNGLVAGQVSSAAWGATVGTCVGLGYLRPPGGDVVTPQWVSAGDYSVDVGGEVYPIRVSLGPLYDPRNTRVR